MEVSLGIHASLIVLALLAFVVGGASGLLGAVFRLVLDRSDRFHSAVVDWAHDNETLGFAPAGSYGS
jgi:chloride channel protein, CIC family